QMGPLKHRTWRKIHKVTWNLYFLIGTYVMYCFFHLGYGSYSLLLITESTRIRISVAIGYSLQALTCFSYPLILYVYNCFIMIHCVQVEQLNQVWTLNLKNSDLHWVMTPMLSTCHISNPRSQSLFFCPVYPTDS